MKLFSLFVPIYLFSDTLTIQNFSAIDNIVLIASSLLLGLVGFWLIEKGIKVLK